MDEKERMNLANIGGGAVPEMFDHALQQVLENIADPNKRSDQKREIVMKFTWKPDDEREVSDLTVSIDVKLAGQEAFRTQAFIGKENGKMVAAEINPRQMGISFDDKQNGPVSIVKPSEN